MSDAHRTAHDIVDAATGLLGEWNDADELSERAEQAVELRKVMAALGIDTDGLNAFVVGYAWALADAR